MNLQEAIALARAIAPVIAAAREVLPELIHDAQDIAAAFNVSQANQAKLTYVLASVREHLEAMGHAGDLIEQAWPRIQRLVEITLAFFKQAGVPAFQKAA